MATNNKEIDITKVGPMGYKMLQEANNSSYKFEDDEINQLMDSIFQAGSQSNPYRDMPQLAKSSLSDTTTPWGSSMFDESSANQNEFENLGDIRAENQPWYSKISAGLAKGAVLAGTTYLNGTLGLVYGIGNAISEGRISGVWDNDFTNFLDEVNNAAEEAMPNYYTQEEKDNPMSLNSIFSANFLGDKLIKNIGFTVGAFYSGKLYSSGLGAIVNGLKAYGKSTPHVISTVGAVLSAINEGSIEGLQAAKEFDDIIRPALQSEYESNIVRINAEYEANRGKSLIRNADSYDYVDPAYIKYQEDIKKAKDDYNEALAKLEEDKAKVGNATLLMNIPILTASNIFQFGKLYSRGFNTSRRTADIVGDIGKYSAANAGKLRRTATVLGGGLSEGTEEVSQQLASDTAQGYYAEDVSSHYKALQDPKAAKESLSWFKTFGESLSSTLGEASTWEQFLIGSITGLMGMPSFRKIRNKEGKIQSPITLENNMFQRWNNLKDEENRIQTIASKLNERVNSPEFKNYYQGLVRHNKYQNDMNDAMLRDDEFDFKNAEHAQLVSDISMFMNAGKIEDLKTLVNSAFDTSDENLQSIIKNTTSTITKEGKEASVGPFIDKNGNHLSKEKMIEELTKQKDNILNTIDDYINTREEIDNNSGQRFTDEQLDELTWMKSQLGNWAKRGENMYDSLKSVIGNVIGNLEKKRQATTAILNFEGSRGKGGLSENYNKADQLNRKLEKAINNLDIIRNLDKDTIVPTLANNKPILEGLIEQVKSIEESVLSIEAKENVIRQLNDISRLGKASQIFQDKFVDYMLNPEKQEEDHIKADEETLKKNIEEDRKEQIKALNNTANFQEVKSIIDNGEATEEDLELSISEAANDYRKANLLRKKAEELIAASDNENKQELMEMLKIRFNENSNYEDFGNPLLINDLPLSIITWDEKEQETFENTFYNILKEAKAKVDSGESQKKNVDTKSTGTKKAENAGKDNVPQPPESKPLSFEELSKSIDKLKTTKEIKTQAKTLLKSIFDSISKIEKNKDTKESRIVQRNVNSLFSLVGEEPIKDLISKVKELTKSDTLNSGTPEEILKNIEAEASKFKPTSVTGVLKSVIPQFDLDAKKDGVLIDFVGENRNSGYSYVYSKLKEVNAETGKNAFDYVNEGNIKEGDLLEVRYEEANDEHSELLGLYHKGTLVNYMNTDESIDDVKDIKEKVKRGENPTVRVSKIMDGQYGYNRNSTQSIGDLLGADDAVIGVMKNRTMEANTDTYIEPVFDEANSDGKVYLLLPNSKGTLSPKQVYIRHFNKREFDLSNQDNPIARDLKQVLESIGNLVTKQDGLDEALDNIYMDLIELLYIPDSFHINIINKANEISLQIAFNDRSGNRQNRNILLRRFASKSIFHFGNGNSEIQEYTATPEEVYDQTLSALYEANLAFNVNAKKLTGKNNKEYANRLKDSNVLATYLTGKRMQGTWFLLNEKPDKTHSNDAFERQKASRKSRGGVRVQFEGNEYFVRGGNIFDATGSIIDLKENNQHVLDLAHINTAYGNSFFGINQHDGKVLIVDKNGERGYNRKTNKYLTISELQELKSSLEGRESNAVKTKKAVDNLLSMQKLVLRDSNGNPDTSNGSYRILEEDNNYHDYSRVHSEIGTNYIGPSKGTTATSKGSLVDEIARQFFIDPTQVKKPEGITNEAFGSLLRGLRNFKEDAEKRGLEIKTDRIVVYHKYPDGRRVAGELDVFAYNPNTGEVSIFDFKTSKYSTKDTSFSKVTNPKLFSRSNKEQYTLQLSSYATLFNDSLGVPVSNLILVPFWLKYGKDSNGEITRIIPEGYIPLVYNKDSLNTKNTRNTTSTKKGQFVTTKNGIEYHKADLQELFTTKSGTFYLTKIGNEYKLVLSNGRAMTIDGSLVSDESGRTKNNIMDFIMAENVNASITEALKSNPLENSPYGNSIVIDESNNSDQEDRIKKQLEAVDKLEKLTSGNPQISNESKESETKEKTVEVKRDLKKSINKELLTRKKWDDLVEDEKAIVRNTLSGMSDEDIKEYWDNQDSTQREIIISCV